jgi:hypothetical protein
VFADDLLVTAIWRNLMIAYFAGSSNALRMRAFRSTQRELSKQEDPVGCLIVQDLKTAGHFDLSEEMRLEVRAAITAYNDRDLAVAVAIDGEGLLAAASRSLVSGLILLARPKYPMKIFGTRALAAAWLLPKMRGGRPSTTITELLETTDTVAAARKT